jgi:HlyD family secretion protein
VIGVAVAGLRYTSRREAPGFVTAPVERGSIASIVTATGTVEAVVTVDVSSQLSGRIAEVFVNFNDDVESGQPIAKLDQEIFAARVSEAKAARDVADTTASMQIAALERARTSIATARTAVRVAQAQSAAAQAKQEEVERDLQRKLYLAPRRRFATGVDPVARAARYRSR